MPRISKLADNITTSPILTFAKEINERIADGEKIYNLTIGDFDPSTYPIPQELKEEIKKAYDNNETNYPGAFGVLALRKAVTKLIKNYNNVIIDAQDVLVSSGSRPLIYATYKAVVNKGDKVVFPVPSWNNEHYTTLTEAFSVTVETKAHNNFMPTKDELAPLLKQAKLLALCSPQNPTGTVLSKQQLSDICDLVVDENNNRKDNEDPLYIMFDQVYWLMAFDDGVFHHASSINNEISRYAIFIDGVSKAFAATGVRVGWATGPGDVISKMRSFIAHIGAWAPKAEQIACANYLAQTDKVKDFITGFTQKLQSILFLLYDGFMQMHKDGLPIYAIKPEASIYLSVKIDIIGKVTSDNKKLLSFNDVQNFFLNESKVAILPFALFGAKTNHDWYRISVGVCPEHEVQNIITSIKKALLLLR